MTTDIESRYAHFLQPIRDLADNWNIDLALELEEYLQELQDINIVIDADTLRTAGSASASSASVTLNFAEAALLIQGSACIYSKKVEYLYTLLYTTLDSIRDMRKNKQKKKKQIEDSDTGNEDEEEAALLPLDDLLEARNIDLDESNTQSYIQERRRSANNSSR